MLGVFCVDPASSRVTRSAGKRWLPLVIIVIEKDSVHNDDKWQGLQASTSMTEVLHRSVGGGRLFGSRPPILEKSLLIQGIPHIACRKCGNWTYKNKQSTMQHALCFSIYMCNVEACLSPHMCTGTHMSTVWRGKETGVGDREIEAGTHGDGREREIGKSFICYLFIQTRF